MRAAKVQASLRIRAVSPEPPLLAHTSSESRGTFRQKARSLTPLNGWTCAVTICHDGMLEDTNSLDGAQLFSCITITNYVSTNNKTLKIVIVTYIFTFYPFVKSLVQVLAVILLLPTRYGVADIPILSTRTMMTEIR